MAKQNKNLKLGLEKTQQFLVNGFERGIKERKPSGFGNFNRLDRQGLGGFPIQNDKQCMGELYLSYDEIRAFKQCAADLRNLVFQPDSVTPKTVEQFLARAVLYAIDPLGTRNSTKFRRRCTEAVIEIETIANNPLPKWELYFQIKGLSPSSCPVKLGKVEFIVPDSKHTARLKRCIGKMLENCVVSSDYRIWIRNELKHYTKKYLKSNVNALLTVSAMDDVSARALALREIKFTIDVINVYAEMLNCYCGRDGYLYLPGEAEAASQYALTLKRTSISKKGYDTYSFDYFKVGPLSDMILSGQGYDEADKHGFQKVLSLLAKQDRTTFEESLLAAFRWAGKATVSDISTQVSIALEIG